MKNKTVTYYNNCEQHDNYFNYHNIDKALCGLQPNYRGEMIFNIKKLLVIQMK